MLLQLVSIVSGAKFIKKGYKISYSEDKEEHEERYIVDKEAKTCLIVKPENLSVQELIPKIVRRKKVVKFLASLKDKSFKISWTALKESMKTRSVDDMRNAWRDKIEPALKRQVDDKIWKEEDDLKLCQMVGEQEISDMDEDPEFKAIGAHRRSECMTRWDVLLMGVGGIRPGKRFKPSKMASKIAKEIESKNERYVAYKPAPKKQRTGMQAFFDVQAYYKENY